jgi:MOSC domain-containing protein YiiM
MDDRDSAALEQGLSAVRLAPRDQGVLEMIVVRPEPDRRRVLSEGRLDPREGLVGDRWARERHEDPRWRARHPNVQVSLINRRLLELIAGERSRWPLAGDNLVVDFDLSVENLPAGQRLAVGSVILEITSEPHRGCAKLARRYGDAARELVNSPVGEALRLRGVFARVIQAGLVRVGDPVRKVGA